MTTTIYLPGRFGRTPYWRFGVGATHPKGDYVSEWIGNTETTFQLEYFLLPIRGFQIVVSDPDLDLPEGL